MSQVIDEDFLSPAQKSLRAIIQTVAAPILYWVERKEVSEIAINRPGEIWLKLRRPDDRGNIWLMREDPKLDRETLESILHILANAAKQPNFGPNGNPIVYGTLPGGHRFCGGYGPNLQYYSRELDVNGTMIFVCRQAGAGHAIDFADYGLRPGQELMPYDLAGDRKADGSDPIRRILNSLHRGDHILISGATDTGKTTFMNEMLRRISEKLRIITVQDTPEISLEQPNHLHIMMSRQGLMNEFTYKHVVDLCVRATPDIIACGEISTTNAATIWELMRSGHGHFMTTIHAETIREAIQTFMTRISHTAPGEVQDRDRVGAQMQEKLRIIQLVKDPYTNERKIVQIS